VIIFICDQFILFSAVGNCVVHMFLFLSAVVSLVCVLSYNPGCKQSSVLLEQLHNVHIATFDTLCMTGRSA
jgi:hypothetical protein